MRQARLDKQKTKEIQTRKQKINNFPSILHITLISQASKPPTQTLYKCNLNEGKQWETIKGRPGPREGGHTTQQRETRRAQWETKGEKTLGKADAPSNKRKQEGVQ